MSSRYRHRPVTLQFAKKLAASSNLHAPPELAIFCMLLMNVAGEPRGVIVISHVGDLTAIAAWSMWFGPAEERKEVRHELMSRAYRAALALGFVRMLDEERKVYVPHLAAVPASAETDLQTSAQPRRD